MIHSRGIRSAVSLAENYFLHAKRYWSEFTVLETQFRSANYTLFSLEYELMPNKTSNVSSGFQSEISIKQF